MYPTCLLRRRCGCVVPAAPRAADGPRERVRAQALMDGRDERVYYLQAHLHCTNWRPNLIGDCRASQAGSGESTQ